MARARSIKPSLFKNEVLGIEDPLLTLLFISLWTLADRDGRLEDRPLRIKAETFPYRENLDVNGYLTVLERLEFIDRYVVAGEHFIQIKNFAKHQKPHNTEKPGNIPPPNFCDNKNRAKSDSCSNNVKQPLSNGELTQAKRPYSLTPLTLTPLTLNPLTPSAGNLKKTLCAHSALFDRFWNSGIRKVNRKKSESAFAKVIAKQKEPASFTSELIDDVQKRLKLDQLGFAEMHPTTYLNGERWKDDYPPLKKINGHHSVSDGDIEREAKSRKMVDDLTDDIEKQPIEFYIEQVRQEWSRQ